LKVAPALGHLERHINSCALLLSLYKNVPPTIDDPTFNLVDSRLLEKVDSLFACNTGNLVDLPQLVVVGHQSSGKSSVLAGTTGLPFPRDSSLYTRFATQIIFHRAKSTGINAFIMPAKDSSNKHAEKIKQWGHRDSGSLDASRFASIIAKVQFLTSNLFKDSAKLYRQLR
jgi:hypothetical protein